MSPQVETTTPPNTPKPIGPYSHIAMNHASIAMMGDHRPARTVIGVNELPKPGVLITMNLTAVTRE